MKADIIVSIGTKRYKLTISKLKEILILNRKPITFLYEGFGSFLMTGLDKKYVKELNKIL